jgi:dephospho-CoA kinase
MISRIYGLTGGVGMGKSTASHLLEEMGIQSVDSDDLARQVVESGRPALEEIKTQFGAGFLNQLGHLNRSKMASIVFGDKLQREKLESIIHPKVRELWIKQVAEWRSDNLSLGIVIIPLLFEVEAEVEFDKVICVACTPNTQHKRLSDRGWSVDQINTRVAAQMDVAEKMEKSDYVLWNESGKNVLREQLNRIIA